MTRRRRILLIVSLLAGVPLLTIIALLVIVSWDEPPPADEDLKVQRLQIPDDQNAVTVFLQAARKLDMPSRGVALASPSQGEAKEGEGPQDERELFSEIADGKRWDGPFVERVLKDNAEALGLWEQGLAAPHFQAIEVKTLADQIPQVFDYVNFGNLVSVRARAAAKRGNYEAAFQDCMKLVRFGHRIEGDKGCLLEWLVGVTVKGAGKGLMRDLLPESTLPPARLRHYAAELAKYPADAGLADAFRNEYAVQVETLEGIKSGKYDPSSLMLVTGAGPARGPGPLDSLGWNVLRVTSFRPHETRRTCAEAARSRIESVSKPFKDMAPEDPALPDFRPAREALSGNLVGRMFCTMLLLTSGNVLQQKCRANVDLAATRILLALKAHKLEKGKLPATLAELVPDYLDSVPLDDYDGQPMRYNAARKVVYSVGKNLTDDGGSTTRAEHVAGKRKEAEAAGEKWTDEDQKGTEAEFDEWSQPDVCFEIKF